MPEWGLLVRDWRGGVGVAECRSTGPWGGAASESEGSRPAFGETARITGKAHRRPQCSCSGENGFFERTIRSVFFSESHSEKSIVTDIQLTENREF